MNILWFIIAGAIAILLTFLLIRVRYDRSIDNIWHSFKSQPTDTVFTEDTIAELDEPVRRYFLHAIKPGTQLATHVELEMSGSFRLKPDADWLPMKAWQIISRLPGFVWKANIGKGLLNFSGADYYSQGKGRIRFSLWGLIPIANARSKEIDRSSAGRLGGEYSLWLPSALLPQNGVAWQAISDNTIRTNFNVDNEPITLTLTIDSEGKLLTISLPRWVNKTENGQWQYIPFGGEVKAEKTFDGYTVPAKIIAGYWFGTEKYWAFFQPTIQRARFF